MGIAVIYQPPISKYIQYHLRYTMSVRSTYIHQIISPPTPVTFKHFPILFDTRFLKPGFKLRSGFGAYPCSPFTKVCKT